MYTDVSWKTVIRVLRRHSMDLMQSWGIIDDCIALSNETENKHSSSYCIIDDRLSIVVYMRPKH
jgi:hypothetical protein